MSQTQHVVQVVLVVENSSLVAHAAASLASSENIGLHEVKDCNAAVEWLQNHHPNLMIVLLHSANLAGLAHLRSAWRGPILCFCDEDEGAVAAAEAAHAFVILPPYRARQVINAVRILSHVGNLPTPSQQTTQSKQTSSEPHSVDESPENELRMEQAQRMEAVGRLAGGIAHDFNNLLTVIGSYSDLATRKLEDDHIVVRYVEQIRKASATAATLTRQLLAFSRRQVLQPRVVALNEIVDEISFMVQSLLGAGIEMRLRLEEELGQIEADPVQLQQVLLNLIVNAKDAMAEGGLLSIETCNIDFDQRSASQYPTIEPGSYVRLAVADTGVGMDRETLTRIYEPFFTTKPKGRGTGLGLPTVYGIVQQSGGYITVYSEVGRGTTFHVYLPRVDKSLEEKIAPEELSETLKGRETILLVEDEQGVREIAALVLQEAGYEVMTAATPEDALALEANFDGVIDLLVTDVIMPRMTGRDMAVRLAPRRPNMPVVYMSGYTEDVMVFQELLDIGAYLIEKPFYPNDLLNTVRRAIDQPAGHEVSTTSAPVM